MTANADAAETNFESDEPLGPPEAPISGSRRRKPGPKNGSRRRSQAPVTRRTVTTETVGQGGEDEERPESRHFEGFEGLFPEGVKAGNVVTKVRVTRNDPPDGILGVIHEVGLDDDFIKEKWGGGVYKLDGLNEGNQIMAKRVFRISGMPKFENPVDERAYYKSKGLQPPADAQAPAGLSAQEVIEMLDKREREREEKSIEKWRRERAEEESAEERRRERQREWEAQMEERRERWEREKREEERKAEERRREDDARRDKQSQDLMAQMMLITKAGADAAVQQAKENAATTIAIIKETSQKQGDPIQAMMQGIELAQKFGGGGDGGEGSIWTQVASQLPGMIERLGPSIGGAVREARGLAPGQGEPGQLAPQGSFQIAPGETASKLNAIANSIRAQGHDPAAVFGQMADNILAKAQGAQAQAQQPPQAPPRPVPKAPPSAQPRPPQPTQAAPPPSKPAPAANKPAKPIVMSFRRK